MKKIKKSSFMQDFQEFVNRGNVMDMAIGVIIGGAFSKIVSSLVNDILMPLFSLLLGKEAFSNWVVVLREAEGEAAAVTLNYGTFLQFVFDFLLVALTIFIVIRYIGKLRTRFAKKEEAQEELAAAPTPAQEELLLTEIRDLLQKQTERIS